MRPISARYTSGRGAPHFLGLGRYTISRGLLGLQYDQINESESESESCEHV